MAKFLMVMVILIAAGCSANVTTSRSFKIKDVEYMQRGFAASAKTIITGEDGSRYVILGHRSTPATGTEVVIVRRGWGRKAVTIKVVDDND